MVQSLNSLCGEYDWIRVAFNFFSGGKTLTRLPSCATAYAIPGFKSLFWKRVLQPELLFAFSHVFVVDSDVELAPDYFEWLIFMRLMRATNVSIMSPAPYGAGNGIYRMNNLCGESVHVFSRCPGSRSCRDYCRAAPDGFEGGCTVCRQPLVEVKAAMFTSLAWAVMYEHMLRRALDRALCSSYGFDLAWCKLIDVHVHGARHAPDFGAACAYLYATPMYHHDDRVRKAKWINHSHHGPIKRSFHSNGLDRYIQYSRWRPKNSLLKSRPCWSVAQLQAAAPELLGDWEGPNSSRVLPLALPNAHACCAVPPEERKPVDTIYSASACPLSASVLMPAPRSRSPTARKNVSGARPARRRKSHAVV
jgi:hypothetical protein